MNVLDLPGPDFLRLYGWLLAVLIPAAFLLRYYLRRPGGDPSPGRLPDLHPFEVAYLAGGPKSATDAVIAALVRGGSLGVDNAARKLKPNGFPPRGVTPLEETVYSAAAHDGRVAKIRQTVARAARTAAGRLEKLGLVVDGSQGLRVRLLPALLTAAVFALGVAKCYVGIERERPVGYLVMLCFVALAFTIGLVATAPNRTRRGSRLLAALRQRNAALRTNAARAPEMLAGNDVALAFALFGAGVFTTGAMDDLRRTLAPPREAAPVAAAARAAAAAAATAAGGVVVVVVVVAVGAGEVETETPHPRRQGHFSDPVLPPEPEQPEPNPMTPLIGPHALGIGWRPELALAIDRRQDLGFVELMAEDFDPTRPLPEPLRQLQARGVRLIPHGVSLSLGGADPIDPARVKHLGDLARQLNSPFVSEHIAFVRAGGVEAGQLLPLPRTRAALDVLVENVCRARELLAVPLALENISALFEWPDAELSEAEFLTEALERTDSLLLLDVANVWANARNLGGGSGRDSGGDGDAAAVRFLESIPLNRLAYVHVAGGVERQGVYHDTHTAAVPKGVLDLLEELCARTEVPGVMLERDDDFPDEPALNRELDAIAAAVARGAARRAPAPAAAEASRGG